MFFISVISFFIFAISGIQLLLGGYLFAGIPALFISGAIPSFATFLNKLRPQYVNQDETKKHTGSSDSDNEVSNESTSSNNNSNGGSRSDCGELCCGWLDCDGL